MIFQKTFLTAVLLAAATICVHAQEPQPNTCNLDSVCFSLDQSGSISASEYADLVNFTVGVARSVSQRTSSVLYSAVSFATTTSVIQSPTTNLEGNFVPAVTNSIQDGTSTNLFGGVRACFDLIKPSPGDPLSERTIVVITDGEDTQNEPNPRTEIINAGISIVTVGIGDNVDGDVLRSLASTASFFLPTTSANLVANAIEVADLACDVVTVTPSPPPMTTPTPLPAGDACQRAYDACDFRFSGFPTTVPTFSLRLSPDTRFTTRILSRTNPSVGVINANGVVPEFIFAGGGSAPITNSGSPPYSPTQFKPYSLGPGQFASGIGHETFRGTQRRTARNRCIRVSFTQYQVVVGFRSPRVVENVTATKRDNKCVVFRTT